MKLKKLFLGVIGIIGAFFISSCGVTTIDSRVEESSSIDTIEDTTTREKETTTTKDTIETTTNESTTTTTNENDLGTKVIGTSGGVMELDDLSIRFPKEALEKDTAITASYIKDQEALGNNISMGFLGAVEFGPSGTTFNSPVEVSMKLSRDIEAEEASIFCYDEVNDLWDFVTVASIKDNIATFSVTHFSKYKCLSITAEMLNKYEELVYTAVEYGYSDAWITAEYYDYLVNEKHVMDYYELFDGCYYEPSQLSIFGNYIIKENEGDPNELAKVEGESNQVGNTYGLCKIAGLTSSYMDFKKEKNKPASERVDVIDVIVDIQYKMINPQIDLYSDKTQLEAGESSYVNVHCHYVNPDNFFYPDFDLPYYDLSLPYDLVHLSVDKKEVVTNSLGRTGFTVTALDEEAETVKVMFYVEGVFGEYSAGYITFNENKEYNITGHIKQEYNSSFEMLITMGEVVTTQRGSLTILVEYDVIGDIKKSKDEITGKLQFKNVTAEITSTKMYYSPVTDGATVIAYLDLFKSEDITTKDSQEFYFTGYMSNEGVVISSTGSSEIVSATGQAEQYVEVVEAELKTTNNYANRVFVTVDGSKLLSGLSLEEGECVYTLDDFKDTLDIRFDIGDSLNQEITAWNIDLADVKVTTETIILTEKEEEI